MMSLDTQQFGLTRYWLSVALSQLSFQHDLFSNRQLSLARKSFLAGKNQLTAIKNWLSNARIIEPMKGGGVTLTDLGKLMAAQDKRAEHAWTWWLLHLHLCVREETFPYCTFFRHFDSDGSSWLTSEAIVEALTKAANDAGTQIEQTSVQTYFSGIDQALRPGWPLYQLGLIERRAATADGSERIRFRAARPADAIVAYATLLYHKELFPSQSTVETRILLGRGLGRSLGLRDSEFRESLTRIHQDQSLGKLLQYRKVVNLDSVQFQIADLTLPRLAKYNYQHGGIRWP